MVMRNERQMRRPGSSPAYLLQGRPSQRSPGSSKRPSQTTLNHRRRIRTQRSARPGKARRIPLSTEGVEASKPSYKGPYETKQSATNIQRGRNRRTGPEARNEPSTPRRLAEASATRNAVPADNHKSSRSQRSKGGTPQTTQNKIQIPRRIKQTWSRQLKSKLRRSPETKGTKTKQNQNDNAKLIWPTTEQREKKEPAMKKKTSSDIYKTEEGRVTETTE